MSYHFQSGDSSMSELATFLLYAAIPAVLSISWCKYRGLEYILIHYRWLFVITFLLPASVIFDVFLYIRSWIVFKLHSAPEKHNARVQEVQKQVGLCFQF